MRLKKKKFNAKFAKLEIKMIYSEAYQDLNLSAKRIFEYFLLQQRWENISPVNRPAKWELSHGQNIQLKYSTFNKPPFRMHNQSIARGIDCLLSHGFIEVSKQGGLCKGSVSEFKPSNLWEKWKKGDCFFKRHPFTGRGFTKHNT
jgi:hypothetical protein